MRNHGTAYSFKMGCHCEPCTDAAAVTRERYRAKHRQQVLAAMPHKPTRSTEWMDHAACKGMDTDLFFKDGPLTLKVQATCAACPVRQQCLDYAIAEGIVHGTWGGLGGKARRAVRRERRAS